MPSIMSISDSPRDPVPRGTHPRETFWITARWGNLPSRIAFFFEPSVCLKVSNHRGLVVTNFPRLSLPFSSPDIYLTDTVTAAVLQR